MKEIKVQIPDGDYCNGCKFLNYYNNQLIDMFDNFTGNFNSGYECKYYNATLKVDSDISCGEEKVKKCFMCQIPKEQSEQLALFLLMSLVINDNKDKELDQNDK